MRLASKQNKASNSQLGKKHKTNWGEKNTFTNRKFSCTTEEITSKFRDKHDA